MTLSSETLGPAPLRWLSPSAPDHLSLILFWCLSPGPDGRRGRLGAGVQSGWKLLGTLHSF